jgi:hypothetical protein
MAGPPRGLSIRLVGEGQPSLTFALGARTMSTFGDQEHALSFLRAEFRREREADFATLRRIPSTSVRQFIDYFAPLAPSAQEALSAALAQAALSVFFPLAPHPYQSGDAAYKAYVDALPLMWDWRYCGARIARMLLVEAERAPDYSRNVRGLSAEAIEAIRAIRPVKAPEVRKVVKLALSQLFADINISHAGGYWKYEGTYGGIRICVGVDYACRDDQLRYEIAVEGKGCCPGLKGMSYERLMGLSFAHWDWLEQSNLDQSIGLLKDLTLYCIGLPGRLPASYDRD